MPELLEIEHRDKLRTYRLRRGGVEHIDSLAATPAVYRQQIYPTRARIRYRRIVRRRMTSVRPWPFAVVGLALPFLRFCLVGAVGFVIDAALLLFLVHAQFFTPISARFFSFGAAVTATFELNRRWTFRDREGPYIRLFAAYLSVQGLGFLCNLGVYMGLYLWLPPPLNRPIICLAIASGVALIINFTGARLAVFRKTPA